MPLLKDPAQRGKGIAFSMVKRGAIQGHSVRTARWRYTEWDQGRRGIELYDQKHDPENICNLASQVKVKEFRTVEHISFFEDTNGLNQFSRCQTKFCPFSPTISPFASTLNGKFSAKSDDGINFMFIS